MAGLRRWIFVGADPEWLWHQLAGPLAYFHNSTIERFTAAGQSPPHGTAPAHNVDDLKAVGEYVVCTPEEAVASISAYLDEVPVTRWYTKGHLPGADPDVSLACIESLATELLPRLRVRAGEGSTVPVT